MLGFFVTLWTSRIVASFHEHKGHRHIRYRDLAAIAMGELKFIAVLKLTRMMCIEHNGVVKRIIVSGMPKHCCVQSREVQDLCIGGQFVHSPNKKPCTVVPVLAASSLHTSEPFWLF